MKGLLNECEAVVMEKSTNTVPGNNGEMNLFSSKGDTPSGSRLQAGQMGKVQIAQHQEF